MGMDFDNAHRVCQSHVEELERFDEWVTEFVGSDRHELFEVFHDEGEDADRRALAGHALAWLDDNGADELCWSAFVNGALDVEVNGRLGSDGWEVTGVALLVSFGGPTVRFVAEDQHSICVDVSWWADRADFSVCCGLAGVLWEIADERASVVAR